MPGELFVTSQGRAGSVAAAAERVPQLDGLRGVAIGLVMMHHFTLMAGSGWLEISMRRVGKLGWIGVDLFFVLSGYLITRILRRERAARGYYGCFYARRALRIVPLYYAYLVFAFFAMPRLVHYDLDIHPLWFWLHASNLAIAAQGFQNPVVDIVWSLAVEEQFYLVWPLLVSLTPPRWLVQVCWVVASLALLTRLGVCLGGGGWPATYVLTPCRFDGLALGALVACLSQKQRARVSRFALAGALLCALGLGGLAAFTRSAHLYGPVGQVFGYSLTAGFGTSLLLLALEGKLVPRWLQLRGLKVLGRYSYSLYLVHVPVGVLLRRRGFGASDWPALVGSPLLGQALYYLIAGVISLGLAWLSWRLFESPILRWKRYFPYGRGSTPASARVSLSAP